MTTGVGEWLQVIALALVVRAIEIVGESCYGNAVQIVGLRREGLPQYDQFPELLCQLPCGYHASRLAGSRLYHK